MRQAPNNRRSRGRGRKPQQSGGGRFNNFDSNGPGGRLRGNAHQLYEKYLTLARDAAGSDDRIIAENYFQHADHYFRVMNANGGGGDDSAQRQRGDGEGPQPNVTERTTDRGDGDAASADRPKQDAAAASAEEAPAPAKRAPRRRPRAKAESEDAASEDESAAVEST